MKKKSLIVSIFTVLLIFSMPFVSTVEAQRDELVASAPTPILTPCQYLWAKFFAEVAAAAGVFIAVVPAGGSLAWKLLILSGLLGLDILAQYNHLLDICGGPLSIASDIDQSTQYSLCASQPVTMSK